MALTRIISEIIQDNTIDNSDISASFGSSISGSLGANASTIRTLSSTTVSGSKDAASISGSLGANAGVIRTLSATTISGSRDATSISGSRDAASISGSLGANASTIRTLSSTTVSGSFGNQRVGTTDNVLFNHITASSNISASSLNTRTILNTVDDLTLDSAGDVIIDADGADIKLKDDGTEFGRISRVSSDLVIKSISNNNDILFKGVDASSTITALTLDMSEAGNAIFNNDLSTGGNITGSNNVSASGNLSITGNVDVDGTSNFAGNVTLQNDLTVTGRIDAEEIHTTFISSSIAQATGSNIFGDATTDSHQFTGSVDVSGSLRVSDGDLTVSDTLTATNLGAFTAAGAINFNNQAMTNVDINSGTINGITDLAITDGGTGASTAAGAAENLGLGITDNVVFSAISGSTGEFTSNITGSGNLGADGDLYVGGRITGSSGATFTDKVGIGTDSPTGQLTIASSTSPTLTFKDTGGGTDSKIFKLAGGGDAFFFEGRNDADSDAGDVGSDGAIMAFSLTTGNVSIGKSSTVDTDRLFVTDGASPYSGANRMMQIKRNATNGSDADSFASLLIGNNSNGFVIGYGGTTDRFRFLDGSGTERVSFENGGNVGIGTTAPSGALHINGANPTVFITNSTQDGASTLLRMTERKEVDGNAGAYLLYNGSQNRFEIGTNISDTDTTHITLKRDGSGNVGIGTNNPATKLHIHHIDADANAGPIVRLQRDNSAGEDNGDILGEIQFLGSDSANDATEYSTIHSKISNVSNTVEEGTMVFKNMVAGSSTNVMNIVGKRVGIGGEGAPSAPIEVSDGTGEGQGSIGYTGTMIACSSASAQEYSDSNSATWGPKINISNETASSTRTAASLVFAHRNSSSGVAAIVSTNAATDRADLRFITRGAGNAIAERMRITDDGALHIGDISNSKQTIGLTINMAGNDNEAISLKSSDVDHGITNVTETDTYGRLHKAGANDGGMRIDGLADTGTTGLELTGTSPSDTSTRSTSGGAPILMAAIKKNGTNPDDRDSDKNLVAIRNRNTTRFIFDSDGDLHSDSSNTTFDQYNDAQLVRSFDLSHGRGVIQSKFDDFIKYQHETLASLGLVGREEDGTPNHFVNVTGMQRLHNGAIWQQYTEMEKMKELMYDTMVELLGKETADKKLQQHDIKLLDDSVNVVDSLWSKVKNKAKSLFKVIK